MNTDIQILSAASSLLEALKARRSGDRSHVTLLRAAHRDIEEVLNTVDEMPDEDSLDERLNEALGDIEAGRVSEPTDDVDGFLESLRRDAAVLRS
jgi:hypothetical protein